MAFVGGREVRDSDMYKKVSERFHEERFVQTPDWIQEEEVEIAGMAS